MGISIPQGRGSPGVRTGLCETVVGTRQLTRKPGAAGGGDKQMSDDWPHCGQCGGISTAGGSGCLAHSNPEDRAAVLKQFSESGDLDVRGVTISEALLKQIFDAAPRNAGGGPTFKGDARFDGATFEGYARFHWAAFE